MTFPVLPKTEPFRGHSDKGKCTKGDRLPHWWASYCTDFYSQKTGKQPIIVSKHLAVTSGYFVCNLSFPLSCEADFVPKSGFLL